MGAAAVVHAERQSDYNGWDDGIVLIAHVVAVLSIFVISGTLSLFASWKFDLPTAVGVMVIFFGAFGPAMLAHNLVQNHYDKLRANNG